MLARIPRLMRFPSQVDQVGALAAFVSNRWVLNLRLTLPLGPGLDEASAGGVSLSVCVADGCTLLAVSSYFFRRQRRALR